MDERYVYCIFYFIKVISYLYIGNKMKDILGRLDTFNVFMCECYIQQPTL